ncbi:MAG: universal stress protein [Actinobacteria bacterium]|jgi:nucleotide-binding universal stress UspA family protein|nr:universal stress protein [Actinomycetota bacterium]
MIKSLLVAMDSSAYARAGLDHALELAKVYKARVTGLYVLDVRYLEMPPYVDYSYSFEAVPPVVAPLDLMDKFRAKSERILGDVREKVEKAGMTIETRIEEGVPGQVIADMGDAFDLIVMGKRGEHAKWARDLLGPTAESVTRRSASPVLLVEQKWRAVNKALVLFDGSHPANRGLKLAADLALRTGIALRVLTADDDAERGEATVAEARAYLEPLALDASYSAFPGKAVKAATTALADDPADLVIMGMRGHSPLRYLILGRTTEQLMRSVELPVLLAP